jgi:hypothetical protein
MADHDSGNWRAIVTATVHIALFFAMLFGVIWLLVQVVEGLSQ